MIEIKDCLQNKNFVMLFLSTVFMAGILTYFSHYEILISFILSLILIFLFLYKLINIRKIIVILGIFYFAFFLTSAKIKNYDDLLPLAPLNSEFQGRIISVPAFEGDNKAKFILEVNKAGEQTIKGKSFVTINSENNNLKDLRIGDEIKLSGNLRKPFKATNPSQFDYSSYLKNFNVYTVIYVNSDNYKILTGKKNFKWRLLKKLNDTRAEILKIHSKYIKSPNLEILGGIVFGQDAVNPPDYIKKSFINSGLLHILAASGMNVAFIFSFWVAIMKFCKIGYRPRIISGMIMVILYTLMTGLGPSVIRASLMLIFILIGKLIDRDAHSIALLALVAVLMLIYNPAYINNISFQLSFLVTLGLLTTFKFIFCQFEKVPNWIKTSVFIPLVAQIWVAPIQMFYFNTFTIYSIFANMSITCILSVISFCGFISSILALIKPIAEFICHITDFALNYMLNFLVSVSDFFSNLPHCIVETSHPEIYQLILYYTMIIVVTFLLENKKFKQALISFLTIGIILLFTSVKPVSKDFEIIAFDVGNADSFILKSPQNKYFFIDTGKAPFKSGNSQAKLIMLKYLKDRGIKNIQSVIVTHFDNDHSGGAADIIQNLKVKELYINGTETDTLTSYNLLKTAKEINQRTIIAQNNNTIYQEPDFKLKTYKYKPENSNNVNNESSIITLASYKNFDILFMGDAGVETYNNIQKYLPNNIEILKVGHHGGPNVVNKNMLENLGVKVSLISTGTNTFGHPNQGTLDTLRETKILRTDLHNSIKITSNGSQYYLYTFNQHDKKYYLREKLKSK